MLTLNSKAFQAPIHLEKCEVISLLFPGEIVESLVLVTRTVTQPSFQNI